MLSASPAKPQLHCGSGWPRLEQAVHRDVHVAELAGEAGGALDHLPFSITPPPRPVPMIAEIEARCGASGAEELVVRVERRGVAVVVVDDGQPQALLERAAEVEVAPARVGEVRGAARRDHARRRSRGRACRARPTRTRSRAMPVRASTSSNATHEGRERDLGAFLHAARASRSAPRPGSVPRRRARWRCSWCRRCRARPPPTSPEFAFFVPSSDSYSPMLSPPSPTLQASNLSSVTPGRSRRVQWRR